jgi:ubiquinone/menaquinone biosynthesis C-methylase UbiE
MVIVMTKKSGFQLSGGGPEAYENVWVPALMGKCAQDLVDCANIKQGDKVLDVGCGTGVVARAAVKLVGPEGKVTGIDLNEGMLDVARNLAEKQGISEIEWQLDDAASMSLDDNYFDVVLCQQGLQFMPDRTTAMAEMARVLTPGGHLAINVWRAPSAFSISFGKVLDAQFGEGTRTPLQMAYSLSDRDGLRSLATSAGFRNAHVSIDVKIARHPYPEKFMLGAIAASPLGGEFAVLDADQRMIFVGDIVNAMDRYIDDDGVAICFECHTLTATK